MPSRMIKYIQNSVVFDRFSKKDCEWALTFNWAIYFSGRFEREAGPEGIVPPFNSRFRLKSRVCKTPHRQLSALSDFGLRNFRNDQISESRQSKSNPLDELFIDYNNDDSDSLINENANFINNSAETLVRSDIESDNDSLEFYFEHLRGTTELPVTEENSVWNAMENNPEAIMSNNDNDINNLQSRSPYHSSVTASSISSSSVSSIIANENISVSTTIQQEIVREIEENLHNEPPVGSPTIQDREKTFENSKFSEFQMEVITLFNNSKQFYVAERLIADNITREDIVASSQAELKQHLVNFFNMSPLEASSVSSILKRKFQ